MQKLKLLILSVILIGAIMNVPAANVASYDFYTMQQKVESVRLDSMFLTVSTIAPQTMFVKPFNTAGPPCSCTDKQATYRYMVVVEGQPPECLDQCGPQRFSIKRLSDRTLINKRFARPPG